jgi:hypothetical protein
MERTRRTGTAGVCGRDIRGRRASHGAASVGTQDISSTIHDLRCSLLDIRTRIRDHHTSLRGLLRRERRDGRGGGTWRS